MNPIRYVDGEPVEMTDEEAAAFEASRASVPDPVPSEVSNVQAHAILIQFGLRDAAQAAITAIPDATERALAQLGFDRGSFVRNSSFVEKLSGPAGLDLPSAQVDEMFRLAAKVAL